MKALTTTISCIAIGISSCLAQETKFSFKENYTIQSPAQLSLSSFDGNIEVIPTEKNEIEVFYIIRKNDNVLEVNKDWLEKENIHIEVVQTTNNLAIAVKTLTEITFMNFWNSVSVSFKVYAPKKTSCDLRTSDGNISLKELESNQYCKTSDGNIIISDINGQVKGSTSDGNVNIKGVTGSVEIKTSDGNIYAENIGNNLQSSTSDGNIALVNITGDVYARTSDGDISFKEISGSLEAGTSDGNIKGEMVTLKSQLTAKTSDGNIYITIPGKLGLDLTIRGESLNVPLTNFSGKSNEHAIDGQSNGGGIPVNLSTSDGNVTLAYR